MEELDHCPLFLVFVGFFVFFLFLLSTQSVPVMLGQAPCDVGARVPGILQCTRSFLEVAGCVDFSTKTLRLLVLGLRHLPLEVADGNKCPSAGIVRRCEQQTRPCRLPCHPTSNTQPGKCN